MGKYVLLGKTVEFSDSAERYYDYQSSRWEVLEKVKDEFTQWYAGCITIGSVLSGYQKKAASLVVKYATDPLYNQLTSLEIYDVSEKAYDSKCLNFDVIDDAYVDIARKYQDILDTQEAEKEYREIRKDSRGRVVGGGFGVGGAIKGMATAGAMNAASGIGHSVANALGNAGSAIAASSQKIKLYNSDETKNTLYSALEITINSAFGAHLNLVNSRITGYYHSVFNTDKAGALLNSAKKAPDKEKVLLVDSFSLCPWNFNLYKYVFVNYPEERAALLKTASRFGIDLSKTIEEVLQKEYTPQAQETTRLALQARERILAIMDELGVTESETLNRLEHDCLTRLCSDYNSTDHSDKKASFLDSFISFEANDRIKKAVIKEVKIWELAKRYDVELSSDEIENIISKEYGEEAKQSEELALIAKKNISSIMKEFGLTENKTFDLLEQDCLYRLCDGYATADEETCKAYIEKVKEYSALEKNREVVINSLNSRIEAIWSAEDGEVFDNVLLNTDITNATEIKKAIQFIEGKGRTSASKKYLDALNSCTEKNIKKANMSQSKAAKVISGIGYFFIAMAVVILFTGDVATGITAAVVGAIPLCYVSSLKSMWNKLTIDGKVVNPAITPKKK